MLFQHDRQFAANVKWTENRNMWSRYPFSIFLLTSRVYSDTVGELPSEITYTIYIHVSLLFDDVILCLSM